MQPQIEEPGEIFPFHRPEFCLGDVAASGLVCCSGGGASGLLPQDGVRDGFDVDLMLQVVVRNEFLRGFRLMSADVNQDGALDVRDVVRLLQHTQGVRLLPDCGAPELDFSPGDLPNLELWLMPEPLTMFQDFEQTDRVRGGDEDRRQIFEEEVLRT